MKIEGVKKYLGKEYKKSRMILGAALLLATGTISIAAASAHDPIAEIASDKSYMQGTIQTNEVSINSKLPGRIVKVYVEEGQTVKAGDILVEISSDELLAKKEQAEAALARARAGVNASVEQQQAAAAVQQKANAGARAQEVAQAQAAYDLMKASYDRVVVLEEKGAVSKQKLDEVRTQMIIAELTLSMAKEGARTEDKLAAAATNEQAKAGIAASEALLDQAQGAVDEVNAYLKDATIYAPIDGVVTTLNSHEGELVNSGTSIGVITATGDLWLEVSVTETKIGNIHEGQAVELVISAYPNESFAGKVSSINSQPDFAVRRATSENGDFDIITYAVKVRPEQVEQNGNAMRAGMTAFVKFEQ